MVPIYTIAIWTAASKSVSHTGAQSCRDLSSTNTTASEQPSVIAWCSTLAPRAIYARGGEVSSLASFGAFSVGAVLLARSKTAG